MVNIETRKPVRLVPANENRERGRRYVLHAARDRRVKLVQLWFVDASGGLKSLPVPPERLDISLSEGVVVYSASALGPGGGDKGSVIALPDPDTFRVLPGGTTSEYAVARMFCDIVTRDGNPFAGDSRYILRENLRRAGRMGHTYYVSTDVEFILRADTIERTTVFSSPDDARLKTSRHFRRELMMSLEALGIGARYEVQNGPESRHELHLSYADALSLADNVITCRTVVKQMAARNHFEAVLASGPAPDGQRLGTYLHQSLFRNGQNAFYDGNDEDHLSRTARAYIASLVRYAPEIVPFTGRWVSWRDHADPGGGPSLCSPQTAGDSAALVGVFGRQPGKESATRIAIRHLDTGHNPYVCFSLMLAAGLEGIDSETGTPRKGAPELALVSAPGGAEASSGGLALALGATGRSCLGRRALGEPLFRALTNAGKRP